MRKITQQANHAWVDWKPFASGNTMVTITKRKGVKYRELYLHGHLIAQGIETEPDEIVRFSMAGWNTPTTRERLTAANISIYQRQGEQYLFHDVPICSGDVYRIDQSTFEQQCDNVSNLGGFK